MTVTKPEKMTEVQKVAWRRALVAATRALTPAHELDIQEFDRHWAKAEKLLNGARNWTYDMRTQTLTLTTAKGQTYQLTTYHNCKANGFGHKWCWHRVAAYAMEFIAISLADELGIEAAPLPELPKREHESRPALKGETPTVPPPLVPRRERGTPRTPLSEMPITPLPEWPKR